MKLMSLFGKIFNGRKRKQSGPTSEDAIGNIKYIEEQLVKKQEFYEQKIEHEIATAKKHAQKNKKLALAALRRKKHHEQELQRIDGVLMKLEGQRQALEDAGFHNEILAVLGETNKALKIANKNLDIDMVADTMDSIAEDMQMAEELSNAISRPIGDVPDEDELMQELLELENEKDVAMPLPEVPAGPITRSRSRASRDKISRQDSEMDRLEAWCAAN